MDLNPAEQRNQEQMIKWKGLGVQPGPQGYYRLPQFMKDFSNSELVVQEYDERTGEYKPFLLRSGRELLAREVIPGIADLVLDEEARMVPVLEFRSRWAAWLDTRVWETGSDPRYESIPDPRTFINQKPDMYSGSAGMIEIDFEPGDVSEFNPQKRFGPNGESEEEWKKQNQSQSDQIDKLSSMVEMLVKSQLASQGINPDAVVAAPAEMPTAAEPKTAPVVSEPGDESDDDPAPIAAKEAKPGRNAKPKERAPCGKEVTKGYVRQHLRHCDHPSCAGETSVNKKD